MAGHDMKRRKLTWRLSWTFMHDRARAYDRKDAMLPADLEGAAQRDGSLLMDGISRNLVKWTDQPVGKGDERILSKGAIR
jgi:hypothetical protein